ncbi:putative membrane protein [Rhizobium sp. NFR07]|uniref:bestrophin family protein n=1 Tax=Rhizobium sp. NFR07 TaxID=1566262 RepID=UPI0008E3EE52|nr:bestrophin family ion channel [Rhizobium sp. NFR07]SFB04448.1 putative membrane protein [Rhizobium sp. NFR07]
MVLPQSARLHRMLGYIGWPLALLFLWDLAVTLAYVYLPHPWLNLPVLPMSLLGSALALFLGFRNNNAYNRWWEARTLWGAMVNASRSFAREVYSLIDDRPESRHLRRTLVTRQIAYVHALRCHLRSQKSCEEIDEFLPEDEAEKVRGFNNTPNAILNGSAAMLAEAESKGWIDSYRRIQIESLLVDMSNAQGGMERIKNTPLPREYAYYPTLFVHAFCILLPIGLVDTLTIYTPLASTVVGFMLLAMDRIGADLQDPFANRAHDVPLSSICRTIQIDLEQLIGKPKPATPLKPVGNVLW